MKKNLLKILGRIIFLTLLCSVSFSVSSETVTIDKLSFELSSLFQTATVYASDKNISGDICIPTEVEYNGEKYSVTEIGGGAFKGCKNITSVEIPHSVVSLDSEAFYGCLGLTSIEIPNSVWNIGVWAFYNCANLNYVYIPSSVEHIYSAAFFFCKNLQKVEFESIESLCKIKFDDQYANPLDTAHHLYINGEEITEVVIPDGVESINDYAFIGCSYITSIDLPTSVLSIGTSSFSECTKLASIKIPVSLKTISSFAFSQCTGLNTVEISDSVTDISNGAFSNCSSLISIKMGNSVRYIGDYVFSNCYSLGFINIPGAVEFLGKAAFSNCSNLQMLTIAYNEKPLQINTNTDLIKGGIFNGVDNISLYLDRQLSFSDGENPFKEMTNFNLYIGDSFATWDSSFSGCPGLNCVEIGNSVKSIGDLAFYGCSGLTLVSNCNSVETIGQSAFKGCSNLKTIDIPNTVSEIGKSVFEDCTSLSSINIPNSITSISDHAFAGCSGLTSIVIPNSVKSIGWAAFFDCTSLSSIDLPDSIIYLEQLLFDGCTSLTSIEIPKSVIAIKSGAFSRCTGLTSVEIPNSVVTIQGGAFAECSSLNAIKISPSVRSIEFGAFRNCRNLNRVEIESIEAWCNINFVGDTNSNPLYYGRNLYLYDQMVSELIIPNTVTRIRDYAFTRGSFRKIWLPATLTSIGKQAFFYCENLDDVYYPATQPIKSNMEDIIFNGVPNNAILWVPEETVQLCKDTYPWSHFSIKAYDFTSGVENMVMTPDSEPASENSTLSEQEIYTLDGIRIYDTPKNLAPGIYIIRQGSKIEKIKINW